MSDTEVSDMIMNTEITLVELCPKHWQKWVSDKMIEVPVYDSQGTTETDEGDLPLIGLKVAKIVECKIDEIVNDTQDGLIPMCIELEDGSGWCGLIGLFVESSELVEKKNRRFFKENDKES